jgi:hypothetical protein
LIDFVYIYALKQKLFMSKAAITCPVSAEKINENVARVAAFFTITVVITGVYFKLPFLITALAADFYLRAFTNGKYSPIKKISRRFADYLGLDEKTTDAAPKKFAAGIGFIFSLSIAGLQWFHYDAAAYLLSAVLLICAGLESFKGLCLGCIIYTYTVLPFLPKANS